ncbi:pyrimidine dimer DNA glycosylase/endonuclease V [Agromyces aerolatus]|uniref:pyrimidine dimer DNA glycosylase/endonuclease V n=1 Tax=Agromyces sp. LY-1074 TaxID=3074080 RepID=UPI00285B7E52|nr:MULTISPECIES: pyrimidine dimer DNA glycosylase/endonuclease V [unclassified Agromyces]MDR5701518.1 pyrimidine dimer DNA glycosylase/endonuclease V [Agromyces sp. LY-1074]MDR5707875.1 pyrimidine dimer DNA glycosylase/endonuclease V [Agromyces sp. LY-1358]
MRIWSLHPRYLDRQGLTACWRETLLAQAVLAGLTKGYTRHPQLERFRATTDPMAAIGAYLDGLADEAEVRGYSYDRTRIRPHAAPAAPIPVTSGQLELEWAHLAGKLAVRSPAVGARWAEITAPETHPLFFEVPGPVAPWERNPR